MTEELTYKRPAVRWHDLEYTSKLTHRVAADAALHAAFVESRRIFTDGTIAECKAPPSMRCAVHAKPTHRGSRPRFICANVCRECSWRRDAAWSGPALVLRSAESEPLVFDDMREYVRGVVVDAFRRTDMIGEAARATASGRWGDEHVRPPRIRIANRERLTIALLDHIAVRTRRDKPGKEKGSCQNTAPERRTKQAASASRAD